MSAKVAIITGASSGIGESTARKLQDIGYTVYAAARRVDRMSRLAERGITVLRMDVTDADSMKAGVERVLTESGRIDVLVNNAGYGSYGAIEEVPTDEARAQFEVNVFGAAHLTQLVLPAMRAQGSGTIVNVSSMGGKIYLPFGGWYHSTKFALEGLSDSLRLEVRPFGINVVVIEPGGIQTEWGDIAAANLRKVSGAGAYAKPVNAMVAAMSDGPMARRGSQPSVIADVIAKAVTARRPKIRYAAGAGARPALFVRRILPDRAFDGVVNLIMRFATR